MTASSKVTVIVLAADVAAEKSGPRPSVAVTGPGKRSVAGEEAETMGVEPVAMGLRYSTIGVASESFEGAAR